MTNEYVNQLKEAAAEVESAIDNFIALSDKIKEETGDLMPEGAEYSLLTVMVTPNGEGSHEEIKAFNGSSEILEQSLNGFEPVEKAVRKNSMRTVLDILTDDEDE